MTIDTLKRELRQYRYLAIDAYDKLETNPDTLRNRLCLVIDNRTARQNPVRVTESFYSITTHALNDEIISGGLIDDLEWTVPIGGYATVVPYNKINIGRPESVAQLQAVIAKMPPSYFRKQVGMIMKVFRSNPLCIDGQDFFDNAHPWPNGKGTYDNTISNSFATAGDPTTDEVKDLLHRVLARFVTNLSIESEVIDAGEVANKLLVIVHNTTHWSTFEKVRTMPMIGTTQNEMVGTFSLLMDNKPTSGQENYIEFVLDDPGAGRPAIYVPDADPTLDAEDKSAISNAYVQLVFQGAYGVKPGHPQSSIQGS